MNYLLLGIVLIRRKSCFFYEGRQIRKAFLLFIGYLFIINLLKNDPIDALSFFLGALPFPFIMNAFASKNEEAKIVDFFIKFYLVYTSVFSLLQIAGYPLTSGAILSNLEFIKTEYGYSGVSSQGLRITGADMNSVWYACILGMIFIYYYFHYTETRKKSKLLVAIFSLVLLLLTQSRAAIFSLFPVIIITEVIIRGRFKKQIGLWSSVVVGLLVIYFIIYPFLLQEFPRLFLRINEDGSVIHRIQANVYGSVGTLKTSPLFGVSFKEGLEMMRIGYKTIGLFIGNYFIETVTHHNQPLYYLRYYGLIGLVLFLAVYYHMYKFARSKENSSLTQKILVAIILFHFAYTLTHNNKITMDYFLFIMIAFKEVRNTEPLDHIPNIL